VRIDTHYKITGTGANWKKKFSTQTLPPGAVRDVRKTKVNERGGEGGEEVLEKEKCGDVAP